MTDTTNTRLENGDINWENFANWIHCICIVTFDLEIGQALECTFPPHVSLTKQEISNICYLAFPDSNSGCMGDTTFMVRLQNSSGAPNLSKEHATYNLKCPPNLQINSSYFWGYVYFRQVKDPSLPRGYFQKSVVILSRLPFNNLFRKVSQLVAPEYFKNGMPSLEAACYNIEQWPPPIPGYTLALPLLGDVFQTHIPQSGSNISSSQVGIGYDPIESQRLTSLDDLNFFEILQPVLSHIHLLWEIVLTTEPLIVMASSPTACSSMVLVLTRLLSPLKFCGDYRPYFTIHDSDFKNFTSRQQGPPPVILGVTNPFFAKTLHHWPHTIKLGDESGKIYGGLSSGSYFVPALVPICTAGQTHKYKLKKNGSTKILDNNPGVYTTYKPFLQKDKTIIKKLLNGIASNRPSEVQSALLKKHLLELTHSFMIPLERYIGSLMPLQKNISPFKPAPSPLPFNPDDFFATFETAGPQLTTGVKGDWIGLYRKFFRSPNFNDWFNRRYKELVLKLQALQLQALSDADLKDWTQGKDEVKIIDMVLEIKSQILKCNKHDIPVSNTVKEQLNQRLLDIVNSLPDDVQKLLKVT